MAAERVGGLLHLKINGELYSTIGNWTYNLGAPKREGVVGTSSVHGYSETPQVPFIDGEITNRLATDTRRLVDAVNVTATLELNNGKVIVLRDAWYAHEGTGNTEKGNFPVRFEGLSAEEVR